MDETCAGKDITLGVDRRQQKSSRLAELSDRFRQLGNVTHTVHTFRDRANLIYLISPAGLFTQTKTHDGRAATLRGLSRLMCWVLAAFIRMLGVHAGLTEGSARTQMWQQQMDAFRKQAVKTCCT